MPCQTDLDSDKLFAISLDYKCPLSWRDMKGDENKRHCATCKQNVYNLSRMTKAEAVAFIQETEGKECVSFYQRRDGTVVTRDCVSILGKSKLHHKWSVLAWINFVGSAIALALLPMFGPACVTIVNGMGPVMGSSGRGDSEDDMLKIELENEIRADLAKREKERKEREGELLNQITPDKD